jgi:hypothetical protein
VSREFAGSLKSVFAYWGEGVWEAAEVVDGCDWLGL